MMKLFKNALLALALCVAIPIAALAQSAASGAVITIPSKVASYSAAFVALVPASGATDFLVLQGSATAVVRIKQISCTGLTTAAAQQRIYGIVRSTADTGGTSTTAVDVPSDSNDAAGSAALLGYTANPTLGTAVGPYLTGLLETGPQSSNVATPFLLKFGDVGNAKEIVLRGITQEFALNANATSFAAGASLDCFVQWTEAGS